MPNKDVILYLDGSAPPPVVVVTEADTAWTFRFTVMYQNAIYAPNVANVVLAGHKPDGNAFAFLGSKSGNVYQVGCNVQMTAVPGDVLAALHLLGGGNRAIPFILRVQPGGGGTAPVASASALTAYATILNRIGNFPPNLAQYVSDWLDEHAGGGGGAVVDNTLNIPGAAADAKVTGDRIRALEAATIETDTTLTVDGAAADARAVGLILGTAEYDLSDPELWEQGTYNTGRKVTSTTRIRLKDYLIKQVRHISVSGNYSVLLYAFQNGSYVGYWGGSGFVQSGDAVFRNDFDLPDADYDYTLVMMQNGGGTIDVSAAAAMGHSGGLLQRTSNAEDRIAALEESTQNPALPSAFAEALTDFLTHLTGTFDDPNGQQYISNLIKTLGGSVGITLKNGVLTILPGATVQASQSGSILTLS